MQTTSGGPVRRQPPTWVAMTIIGGLFLLLLLATLWSGVVSQQ